MGGWGAEKAWNDFSGAENFVGCFVLGVKIWHEMYCPGMFCH